MGEILPYKPDMVAVVRNYSTIAQLKTLFEQN